MNERSQSILERMDSETLITWDGLPKNDAELTERINIQAEANYQWLKRNNIEVTFGAPRIHARTHEE